MIGFHFRKFTWRAVWRDRYPGDYDGLGELGGWKRKGGPLG